MAKRHLIVPLFIPHQGCPYRCVFCDQEEISGEDRAADRQRLEETLKTYLCQTPREKLPEVREAAFYGGTFTGLPVVRQEFLLGILKPWVDQGWVQSLRVSTHARYINDEVLERLWRNGVKTIELGVQSLDPHVSSQSGRENAVQEVPPASQKIKSKGFKLGLQLMSGLPGDCEETFLQTVNKVIQLRPDFIRIYPTLVLKDTALYDLYIAGKYEPWSLERTLSLLKQAVLKFREASIPIIRMGLHPEPGLLDDLVAGPFHPSLKYEVDCRLALDEMAGLIQREHLQGQSVIFRVPFNRVSHYTGSLKKNLESLKQEYNLKNVLLKAENGLSGAYCAPAEGATGELLKY